MLDAYCKDALVIVTETLNSWGEVTGTSSLTVRCRAEFTSRKVFTGEGEEAVAKATAYVPLRSLSALALVTVDRTTRKKVQLNGVELEIVGVNTVKGGFSNSHLEVFLK